jgi:hypothetical protein
MVSDTGNSVARLEGKRGGRGAVFEAAAILFFSIIAVGLLIEGNYVPFALVLLTVLAVASSLVGRLKQNTVEVLSNELRVVLKGEAVEVPLTEIEGIYEGRAAPQPDASAESLTDGVNAMGTWAATVGIEELIGAFDLVIRKRSGELISLDFTGTGISRSRLKEFLKQANLSVSNWKHHE